jgi:hypothetical protein
MFGYVSSFPLRFASKDADGGWLRRCAVGEQVTEEEMEREVHKQILAKEKRGKLSSLIKPMNMDA